jgi:hypothetical protein
MVAGYFWKPFWHSHSHTKPAPAPPPTRKAASDPVDEEEAAACGGMLRRKDSVAPSPWLR